MKYELHKAFWLHEPKEYAVDENKITITTEPGTDFWQRTYYGFQNDSAPALLLKTVDPYFSFVVKTEFNSKHRYDQCGVILYQNSENWFKASIEFENDEYQRLGSVVTNHGFSDWATTDIPANVKTMYYRLSRRESDYCIESSYDGIIYKQMRIFHLFEGGEEIQFGVYACSPEQSSFDAVFSELEVTECKWKAHQ
ncbi:hypothetical protein SAMN04487969_101789 [Paenibacillus algorifonticola]|uniref:DUF1349 domain-containing protein n=1 Tax=Paenibacillus algorifonticola TaxID=684063 RepID=A0A1I1YU02_9BACL|nr:DUF1349 domain-containing protein [Paenibacillus algorifonticola]SFE23074.1 hypothetical protein SAMN04487969_101789 [Paenibacillus algorifonticola]